MAISRVNKNANAVQNYEDVIASTTSKAVTGSVELARSPTDGLVFAPLLRSR